MFLTISAEEGVCFSMDMHVKYNVVSNFNVKGVAPAKFFDPLAQLNKDSVQLIMDIKDQLEAAEYAMIGGHPGYVDSDLFAMTTLSIERAKDAEMMMSEKIINWVKENNIELITYRDLI